MNSIIVLSSDNEDNESTTKNSDDAFRNNVQDVNVVKQFHLGTNEINTYTNMISKSELLWNILKILNQ